MKVLLFIAFLLLPSLFCHGISIPKPRGGGGGHGGQRLPYPPTSSCNKNSMRWSLFLQQHSSSSSQHSSSTTCTSTSVFYQHGRSQEEATVATADPTTTTTTIPTTTVTKTTLYEILGADESATKSELKKCYVQLAKRTHPDALIGASNGGGVGRDDSNTAAKTTEITSFTFYEVSNAWKVLGNNKERKRYDTELKAKRLSNQIQSNIIDNSLEMAFEFLFGEKKKSSSSTSNKSNDNKFENNDEQQQQQQFEKKERHQNKATTTTTMTTSARATPSRSAAAAIPIETPPKNNHVKQCDHDHLDPPSKEPANTISTTTRTLQTTTSTIGSNTTIIQTQPSQQTTTTTTSVRTIHHYGPQKEQPVVAKEKNDEEEDTEDRNSCNVIKFLVDKELMIEDGRKKDGFITTTDTTSTLKKENATHAVTSCSSSSSNNLNEKKKRKRPQHGQRESNIHPASTMILEAKTKRRSTGITGVGQTFLYSKSEILEKKGDDRTKKVRNNIFPKSAQKSIDDQFSHSRSSSPEDDTWPQEQSNRNKAKKGSEFKTNVASQYYNDDDAQKLLATAKELLSRGNKKVKKSIPLSKKTSYDNDHDPTMFEDDVSSTKDVESSSAAASLHHNHDDGEERLRLKLRMKLRKFLKAPKVYDLLSNPLGVAYAVNEEEQTNNINSHDDGTMKHPNIDNDDGDSSSSDDDDDDENAADKKRQRHAAIIKTAVKLLKDRP